MRKSTPYRFDEFRVDTKKKCLTFRGQPVPITPKAFQTLVVLLRSPGQVVEKDRFLDEVWADTFVEESTLAQNILTVRKTLGRCKKDEEFIVTVPKRGYQFVAEVHEEEEEPADKEVAIPLGPETVPANASATSPTNPSEADPNSAKGRHLRIFGPVAAVSLIILITSAIAYFAFGRRVPAPQVESQFQRLRVDPIVADADIRYSVISPSGRHLLLLQVKEGIQSLYLREIESGNTIELVSGINGKLVGATFSPIGEQIYYTLKGGTDSESKTHSTLYRLSPLGGASQAVLHGIDSPVAISSDERRLAFIRRVDAERNGIVTADVNGKDERDLSLSEPGLTFAEDGLSWSPDGQTLAAPVFEPANNRGHVAFVDARSGKRRLVSGDTWRSTGQTLWLADGSGVITAAFGTRSPNLSGELWVVPYPSGNARLIADGINAAYGISMNAANGSIIAVESEKFACFLVAPVENLFRNTHVLTTLSDESPYPLGADWTTDGLIAYAAADAGNADIFTITESGEKRQLTSDRGAEISPRLSSDGSFLTFLSNRSGQMDVWRADANGLNARQITRNGNVKDSIISPDGQVVFYLVTDPQTGKETLWRVDVTGENARQLTTAAIRSPRISPDSRSIAGYILDDQTNSMRLVLISPDTGAVIRSIRLPEHQDVPFLDWAKDGQSLYVVLQRGKPQSLWKVGLNGEAPVQLREWENDAIFRFAISRDGDKVFYEVGNRLNRVVEIRSLDSNS